MEKVVEREILKILYRSEINDERGPKGDERGWGEKPNRGELLETKGKTAFSQTIEERW